MRRLTSPNRKEVVGIMKGYVTALRSPEETSKSGGWAMAHIQEPPPIGGTEITTVARYIVATLRKAKVTYNTVCNVTPNALWLATAVTHFTSDGCSLTELSHESSHRMRDIWAPINSSRPGSSFQPENNILLVGDTTEKLDIMRVIDGVHDSCVRQGADRARVVGFCNTFDIGQDDTERLAARAVHYMALAAYEDLRPILLESFD